MLWQDKKLSPIIINLLDKNKLSQVNLTE